MLVVFDWLTAVTWYKAEGLLGFYNFFQNKREDDDERHCRKNVFKKRRSNLSNLRCNIQKRTTCWRFQENLLLLRRIVHNILVFLEIFLEKDWKALIEDYAWISLLANMTWMHTEKNPWRFKMLSSWVLNQQFKIKGFFIHKLLMVVNNWEWICFGYWQKDSV